MKVKNTSRRVIKLLNGKEKVTLVPGTDDVYDVTDSDDVQHYIEARDLIEVVAQRGRAARRSESKPDGAGDRKSTRLNSSHVAISYAVFCLKKKKRADR